MLGTLACINTSYLQATLSRADRDFAGVGPTENDQHPNTGGFSRIRPTPSYQIQLDDL